MQSNHGGQDTRDGSQHHGAARSGRASLTATAKPWRC